MLDNPIGNQSGAGPLGQAAVAVSEHDGTYAVTVDVSAVLGATRSGPARVTMWVDDTRTLSLDANFCSPRVLEELRRAGAAEERAAEEVSNAASALHDLQVVIGGLARDDGRFEGFVLPEDQQPYRRIVDGWDFSEAVWPVVEQAIVPLLNARALSVAGDAAGSTYLYNALVAHPEFAPIFEEAPVLGTVSAGVAWIAPTVAAVEKEPLATRLRAAADAILQHSEAVPEALKQYAFPSPLAFVEWLTRVPCSTEVIPPPIDNEPYWPDTVLAVHRASETLTTASFDRLKSSAEWFAFHAACYSGIRTYELVLADPPAAVRVLDKRVAEDHRDHRPRARTRTYGDWQSTVIRLFERIADARRFDRQYGGTEPASLDEAFRGADAVFVTMAQEHAAALEVAALTSVEFPKPAVHEHAWGHWRLRAMTATRDLAELRYTTPNVLVMDLEGAAAKGEVVVYALECRRYLPRYMRAGAAVTTPDGRLLQIRPTPLSLFTIPFDEVAEALRAAHVKLRRSQR